MSNTYEKNQILSLLYRIFQAEDYRWFNQNKDYVPTFEEIERTVDGLESAALECKGAAETGRIRVVYDKESQTFEYYLSLGGC